MHIFHPYLKFSRGVASIVGIYSKVCFFVPVRTFGHRDSILGLSELFRRVSLSPLIYLALSLLGGFLRQGNGPRHCMVLRHLGCKKTVKV